MKWKFEADRSHVVGGIWGIVGQRPSATLDDRDCLEQLVVEITALIINLMVK
jgi:hypothetical protein